MGGYGVALLLKLGQELTYLAEEQIPLSNMVATISEHQLAQEVHLERFLRTKRHDEAELFIKMGHQITDEVKMGVALATKAKNDAFTKADKDAYQGVLSHLEFVQKAHKGFEEHGEAIIKKIKANDNEGLTELLDITEKESVELEHELSQFLKEVEHAIAEAAFTAEEHEKTGTNVIAAISIFFLLFGLLIFMIILRASVGLVNNIKLVTKELADSSSQVSTASDQLSNASQALSSSSSEQASSVEETSASLEEITGMVASNVDNARGCMSLSELVKKTSEEGNESMIKLVKSMKDILDSNEKNQELVDVIAEIGEKTAIIDEIVFQTKLLSFNASVEAERAGEHGRGFAVVAQEVGNLAQLSGKAADEISTIVKESVKNAETISAENKANVVQGNELVEDAAEYLKEINSNVSKVLESVSQILNASEEQSGGISQINIAISQIDKVTQENAATSEEAASASVELSAQTETLKNMVTRLTMILEGTEERRVESKSIPDAREEIVEVQDISKERQELSAVSDVQPIRPDTVFEEEGSSDEKDKSADEEWEKIG